MKSLVVMTYYQLMHAIATALTFDEKPNLYFSMSYIEPEEELLERISGSGVFNKVVGITRKTDHQHFLRELRKTLDMDDAEIDSLGSSLFDKYLDPHYEEAFRDADPDDEIYIYNDFQWHFYYINKHFSKIVGVEDGYASLQQQISIHILKGDAALLEPFIEKGYYPQPLYRSEKIRRLISSRDFDDLDEVYRKKLEVLDFRDIVSKNPEGFRDAMLYIFNIDKLDISENSSLMIGQPLDRAKYCTYLQNYLLNKKYIRKEIADGNRVMLKPHPAEKNDWMIYGGEHVTVLPKAFPIEVLNYQEKRFGRIVTFSSTSISNVTCGDTVVSYFNKTDTSPKEVAEFIKNEIRKEKLTVDFFVKVREMSPEAYISAYSCIFRRSAIHTNVHIIFLKDADGDYKDYFAVSKLEQRIKEYKANNKGNKRRDLWHLEFDRIKGWIDKFRPEIDFLAVTNLDDWVVFREAVTRYDSYDYMMMLEGRDSHFSLTEKIFDSLNRHMSVGMCFQNYTEKVTIKNRSKKTAVRPGYVGNDFSGDMSNCLWHREVIREFQAGAQDADHFARIVNKYYKNIGRKQGVYLYVDSRRYLDIEDGEDHFGSRIRAVMEQCADDPDYMAGQIANIAYDYYDWSRVAEGETFAYNAFDALDTLVEDEHLREAVYRKLAASVMYEKALEDNNNFMQDREFYMGMKKTIDLAAKEGMLKRVENRERIKKKLRKIFK